MFHAEQSGDLDTSESLEGVLLAGRRVPGVIQSAGMLLGIAIGGDAADWLAARLTEPLAREMFMDPDIDLLALGSHERPNLGLGIIAVFYRLFRPETDVLVEQGLLRLLAQQRASIARETVRLETPPELTRAAQRVNRGELLPQPALNQALREANVRGPLWLTGLALELPSVGAPPEFPNQLMKPELLECTVVVTHMRRPGAAWGHYVAFIVWADEASEELAFNAPPAATDHKKAQ